LSAATRIRSLIKLVLPRAISLNSILTTALQRRSLLIAFALPLISLITLSLSFLRQALSTSLSSRLRSPILIGRAISAKISTRTSLLRLTVLSISLIIKLNAATLLRLLQPSPLTTVIVVITVIIEATAVEATLVLTLLTITLAATSAAVKVEVAVKAATAVEAIVVAKVVVILGVTRAIRHRS
jgi:hypothetical protein